MNTMKVNVTGHEIMQIQTLLQKIATTKMPADVAFEFSPFMLKIQEWLTDFYASHAKLVEIYSEHADGAIKHDDKGQAIICQNKVNEFNVAVESLLSQMVDVPSVPKEAMFYVELTPREMVESKFYRFIE